MKHVKLGFLLLWHAASALAGLRDEHFTEDLLLRPLRDGRLAARFSFATVLKGATPRDPATLSQEDDTQHYTLFPLALGQILREYAVTELHLTLNAGSWNYDAWGYPDEMGVGTGAELWAWMGDGAHVSVDRRWQDLRNALAGLFCASLGSLDEQRTTSPALTFQPEGAIPDFKHPHQLRHATLPSEHVCTENLTPFLKLLPCKSRSGIASLLNPHKVFDADWHGLGVHVRYRENVGVEVRLAFQAVFDPVRQSHEKRRDWSLRSVFDKTIERACPVAQSSTLRVALPQDASYSITPEPSKVEDGLATYVIATSHEALDVSLRWPAESRFEYPNTESTPPLTDVSIRRSMRGTKQSEGQMSVLVTNHLAVDVQAGYLETMPWLLQFYLHTLRASVNAVPRDDLVSIMSYTSPELHARPTLLQAALTIPARSTLKLTLDVEKAFLRYTEHQPDAHRGWDMPAAVLVPFAAGNGSARARRMYTGAMLVDVAVPDFSMPYNVIIMSCTLIALVFGMVFNLLTRKITLVRLGPAPKGETEETQEKVHTEETS